MKGRIVWSVRTQGLGPKKKKKTYRKTHIRKEAPELALDFYVRAIAVESGKPLEVMP